MGSTLGGGIQITLGGGISARNLVTRFVWLCFKKDLLLAKNESGNFFWVVKIE